MPKSGFKSYAIKEELFHILKENFEDNKEELAKKGINSLSGFFTYLVNKQIEEETKQKKFKQKIEKVKIISQTIILKDNSLNKIIELNIKQKKIFCEYHQNIDCIHVGFAYSIPEVIIILDK